MPRSRGMGNLSRRSTQPIGDGAVRWSNRSKSRSASCSNGPQEPARVAGSLESLWWLEAYGTEGAVLDGADQFRGIEDGRALAEAIVDTVREPLLGASAGHGERSMPGLGTSIVKELAKQLDGRVDVSMASHGTSVSVTHGSFTPPSPTAA